MNRNVVVEYEYDAWGNSISTQEFDSNGNSISLDIANVNPYRYRGYRYDEETSLYYLNSRFYDSNIGRFINADGLLGPQGNILGHNIYAYTQNNPVMMVDPNGHLAFFIATMIIGAIIGGILGYMYGRNQGHDGWEMARDIIVGTVAGGVMGAIGGALYSGAMTASFSTGFGNVIGGTKTMYYLVRGSGYAAGIISAKSNLDTAFNTLLNSAPPVANKVLSYLDDHNGTPPPGYRGGRVFANDGRDFTALLPKGTTYREYDIYPKIQGISRGVERIVMGLDGSCYYTWNHYFDFIKIR